MKHRLAFDNVSFENDVEHPPSLHSQVDTVTVHLLGITGQASVQSIEGHISKVKGIVSAKVSLKESNAVIKYLEAEISPHQICQEIKDLGFDASTGDPRSSSGHGPGEAFIKMKIEGMACQSCVNTIEEKIGKLHGVKKIKVSLSNQEASITYHPIVIKPEELKNNIDSLGYGSTIKHKQAPLKLGLIDSEQLWQGKVRTPDRLDGGRGIMGNSATDACVVVLGVEGMHCKSCVNLIEGSVSDVPGVRCVKVSLEQKNAVVQFDKNLTTPTLLQQAIQALPPGNFRVSLSGGVDHNGPVVSNTTSSLPCISTGPPKVETQSESSTTVIKVDGMTCSSCVKSIETALSQRKGVVHISVSLTEGTATISYSSFVTNPEDLRAAIEDMGFDASVLIGITSQSIKESCGWEGSDSSSDPNKGTSNLFLTMEQQMPRVWKQLVTIMCYP